jgi:hypothetical protein
MPETEAATPEESLQKFSDFMRPIYGARSTLANFGCCVVQFCPRPVIGTLPWYPPVP